MVAIPDPALPSKLSIPVRSWLTTLLLLPLSEELQVLLGHKLSNLSTLMQCLQLR